MILAEPYESWKLNREHDEINGDNHFSSSYDTPLRPDAFDLDDETKIKLIQEKFSDIMNILGLDLSDDSLKGTPYRVAKMFVNEVFNGLNPKNKPNVKTFENKYQYKSILIEKNINVQSFCEHHFLPIVGKANIGYIPDKQVVGLSKLNRIVDYYSRRPQVQERLTRQILEELKSTLQTEDVIVMIDAKHLCVSSRGIKDLGSSTLTIEGSGKFKLDSKREEFISLVSTNTNQF
ncbi:MAG: GTP cyclohydrolase I FolE [Spirochaetia bacterium]|nr:GTP cyclohydrolase I FolE [Spirochaetia bacterium]